MDYQEFICAVENAVRKEADGKIRVAVNRIVKNNGKVRVGMVLSAEGINIAPTIYLEEYFTRYEAGGMTIGEAAQSILEMYGEVKFSDSFEGEFLMDFEGVKDRIAYKLIGREQNAELLQGVPHTDYLDLAVVFYILLDINDKGSASVLIRNNYLDIWGIGCEEVMKAAENNTVRMLPARLRTMKAMIQEMFAEEITGDEDDDYMYVLTNSVKNFGASCLLYPEMTEYIWERLKENYYVLPSSIHEVIIIPESKSPDKGELADMIREINRTQVEAEEVLSDRPYYYERNQGRLMI